MNKRMTTRRRKSFGTYELGDKPGQFRVAVTDSIIRTNLFRLLITGLLVGYTIAIITAYSKSQDQSNRETLEFTSKVLMGNAGTAVMLFWIWFITIAIIATLPVLMHILYKLRLVKKD